MTGAEKIGAGVAVKSAEGIAKIFFESKIDGLKRHLREKYIEKQISSKNIERIFESYIKNVYRHCATLETIMFPLIPIAIEDVYEPLDLKPFSTYHGKVTPVNSSYSRDIIHDDLVKNLTILDTAGMGKSTFCKHLVVKIIKNTSHSKIPVFVELRKVKKDSIIKYIVNEINLGYKNILSVEMFHKLMERGNFLFIFDGFDEVDLDDANKLGSQINELSSNFDNNIFILTSRKQEYIPEMHNKLVVSFVPLSPKQIESLVLKYDKVICGNIGNRLINHNNYKILDHTLFETPLMVNLLYRSFSYNNTIDSDIVVFYDEMFSALYKGHDLTKAGYLRDKKSGLKYEEFKLLFSALCFFVLYNNKSTFSSNTDAFEAIATASKLCSIDLENSEDFFEDLLSSVPLLSKDGQEYKFIHKTIIEFFAAQFINFSDESPKLIEKILDSSLEMTYKKSFEFLYKINKSLFIRNIGNKFIDNYVEFNKTSYKRYCNTFKTILYFSNNGIIQIMKENDFDRIEEIPDEHTHRHTVPFTINNIDYVFLVTYSYSNMYGYLPSTFLKSMMSSNHINIIHMINSKKYISDMEKLISNMKLKTKYKITGSKVFALKDVESLKVLLLYIVTAHLEDMMCYPYFRQVPLKITQPFDILAS